MDARPTDDGRQRPASSATSPKQRPDCPDCGTATIPIVYGMPGGELFERSERGEVKLGGCMPMDEVWHCPACDMPISIQRS